MTNRISTIEELLSEPHGIFLIHGDAAEAWIDRALPALGHSLSVGEIICGGTYSVVNAETLIVHRATPALVSPAVNSAEHGHRVFVMEETPSPLEAIRSLLCGATRDEIRRTVKAVMPVTDRYMPIPIFLDEDGFADIFPEHPAPPCRT